ncbi:hypothetical protein ACP275_02G194500 [Erythranthe tilingii]
MWAALPLQPLTPWPPNTISTTKPPPRRHHPVTVCNFQNLNTEEKGGTAAAGAGLGRAVQKAATPQEKQAERQLSGADVLMALQIVAAKKAKKKKEARDSSKGRSNFNNKERNRFQDFSNVRPLCIQPHWTDLLEELERRLEQLSE